MLFSILVPVYNVEKYLIESIESVLRQTSQEFELILVDDGSTDSSGRICDDFAKRFPSAIKVIHQINRGQLISRCRAIQEAIGDYCLFLDADDMLANEAFEILNSKLEQYHYPDLLLYSFCYEYEDGTIKHSAKLFEKEKDYSGEEKHFLYEAFFSSTLLNSVCMKLVKNSVLKQCIFEEEKYSTLRCAEDRLQSMEIISKAKSIVYSNRELYHYRMTQGSTTRDYSPEAINRFNSVSLYEKTIDYMKKWDMYQTPWRQHMEAGWFETALYVLFLFYDNSANRRQRKQILHYDWQTFIPQELHDAWIDNPCINDTKKRLWNALVEKDFWWINLFLWKRSVMKNIRTFLKKR